MDYKAKAKARRLNTRWGRGGGGDFLILLLWVLIISSLVGSLNCEASPTAGRGDEYGCERKTTFRSLLVMGWKTFSF